MSRMIYTNSPGKRRNYYMRTIAELLRRLGSRQGDLDDEARDMVATIAISLREVTATVYESVAAWEKRNYWKKASDFEQQWAWASRVRQQIETIVREDRWDDLPEVMMKLLPHVSDIEINKWMRKEDTWRGAYDELLDKLDQKK